MVATTPKTTIGIREFKSNPGKFARMVRDSQQEIELTIRGEVVARLVPASPDFDRPLELEPRAKPSIEELERYWRKHDEIVKEISRHLPKETSAAEITAEMRRDL